MPVDSTGYQLILADGTVLDQCQCGYASGSLWCFLKNIQFSDVFQYFSSPEKFETVTFDIVYQNYTDRFIYSGMEKVSTVVQSEDTIQVKLEGYQITVKEERIHPEKAGEE